MSKLWSSRLKETIAYIPGEQPKDKKYIKLNTNENPYPPALSILDAIKEVTNEDLKLYPDPDVCNLKEIIANGFNLSSNQVFVGNGSDEVLSFSFLAFFSGAKEILFPRVTFGLYKVSASLFKIPFYECQMNDDLSINLDEFNRDNGGIVIANPNANTGLFISIDKIENLLQKNSNSVVIIDEAYVSFGGRSCVDLIHQYENLLIVQTMSKSKSLAGLRIGYALGNQALIKAIEMVKNSFNSYTVDRLALVGAIEAFKQKKYYDEISEKIIITREKFKVILKAMNFHVLDSQGNFLFIKHAEKKAEVIFRFLKDNGILVRHFKQHEIQDFIRISIGTENDMDALILKLRNLLQ